MIEAGLARVDLTDTGKPDALTRAELAASTAKTLAVLALLQLALPLNLGLTAAALLRSAVRATPRPVAADRRTILISGGKMTKALQLARSFHAAGHRVILVESHKYRFTGHRFSTAVAKFYPVPAPQSPDYPDALLDIVRREGVDVYVPVCSPVASYYDAVAKQVLAPHCEVLHCDPEVIARLDDKASFSAMAAEVGLPVPESYRITDPAEVERFDFDQHPEEFILKSIPYDPVQRLDLTRLPRPTTAETGVFARSKPISADNPWIMQAFVRGQEYCTHSTVRNGQVQVYCCCESSAFQLNYAHVDKPEIEAWVRRFCREHKLTGQVSFDFIEAEDGRLFAIECNPRTHSAITMFYDNPAVAAAYLQDGVPLVQPSPTSRPTYWLYHELWLMLSRPKAAAARFRIVRKGKEAIFDWSDPLPFLLVHHLQLPSLLLGNLRHGKPWLRVDFNIGKLIEPAGD